MPDAEYCHVSSVCAVEVLLPSMVAGNLVSLSLPILALERWRQKEDLLEVKRFCFYLELAIHSLLDQVKGCQDGV